MVNIWRKITHKECCSICGELYTIKEQTLYDKRYPEEIIPDVPYGWRKLISGVSVYDNFNIVICPKHKVKLIIDGKPKEIYRIP